MQTVLGKLSNAHATTLQAVRTQAERLLNQNPRFKYFTLHGTRHLEGLFTILELLLRAGLNLTENELFLLSISICVHDLGMVMPLTASEAKDVLAGKLESYDPAVLEDYIRDTHHDRIEHYLSENLNFLLGLGISPADLGLIKDISRCHRRLILQDQTGAVKRLGALIRVIDELDIGSQRAPADVFMTLSGEMDTISCWHWFKHNIVDGWSEGHNVNITTENGRQNIAFAIIVRPTKPESIPYWLHQIRRPIAKALYDNRAREIIKDSFGLEIDLSVGRERSSPNNLGNAWAQIEERVLTSNLKVILVIDDEARKLEDLFTPFVGKYHIVYSPTAADAVEKLGAFKVDLAIVDMQISAGSSIWNASETQDFKTTGVNICAFIREKYPATKIAVLTGTRHPIPDLSQLNLSFFLKKPVHPNILIETINAILQ